MKHDEASLEEFGGGICLSKAWGKNVLRRMGFTKRRVNSKLRILLEKFEEIKEQYLIDSSKDGRNPK